MRKQMKALEEKNVTYMKETMNLQEVLMARLIENTLYAQVNSVESFLSGYFGGRKRLL